jgi:hypothetical protein
MTVTITHGVRAVRSVSGSYHVWRRYDMPLAARYPRADPIESLIEGWEERGCGR